MPRSTTRPTSRRPMLLNVALLLLAVYALLVLLVFIFQRRLLYFPIAERPEPWFALRQGVAFWPSESEYCGFLGPEPEGEPRGTVVVFHGNGGRAIERTDYVDALTMRGFRVILAEYPGYGGRIGAPSETSLREDARRTIEKAASAFPETRIFVVGESLGTGVAAAIAGDPKLPIQGVALITPFDALTEVAQRSYPFLPARWMLKDRFDSITRLKEFKGRVAVLVSEKDELIPPTHGKRLYDSLSVPAKKLWTFPGAGHNSWPSGKREPWWDEAFDFLSE